MSIKSLYTTTSRLMMRKVSSHRWQKKGRHIDLLRLYMALLLLAGCYMPWGVPESTSKAVKAEDIAGIWLFGEATLRLDVDGTFEISGSQSWDGHGTWSIRSTTKDLLLLYDSRTDYELFGYVIDVQDGGFGLFGGEIPDPDFWQPMERVETAPE